MFNISWRYLQVFAEGGEGAGGEGAGEGTAAATVVQPADDGQGELRKRGFTDAQIVKIQKDMARRSAKGSQPAAAKQAAPAQGQQSSAAAQEASPAEGKPQEEIPPKLADILKKYPSINDEVQGIVKSRLKGVKGSEQTLKQLTPLLSMVAGRYDIDLNTDTPDYESLIDAFTHDEHNYEDIALEKGVTSKKAMDDTLETLEQQKYNNHFAKMEQDAQELQKVFPGFNLRAELQNPVFARMTAPDSGLSLEDAYHAIHHKEIQQAAMQVTAQQTAERLSAAVQSGSRRPAESGTSSQAPSVSTFSYANASRQQQEAFKAELRRAWGRGETVYPTSR